MYIKGVGGLKKNSLFIMLFLAVFILFGCQSKSEVSSDSFNSHSQSSTDESLENNRAEDIKEQTISEHFTDNLKDEIWLEIEVGQSSGLTQDSRISAFMVTNETYHDSFIYEAFNRLNESENGYISITLEKSFDIDDRPTLSDVVALYYEDKLYEKIYNSYLDSNKSINDRSNENFGQSQISPPYSDKLTFRHVIGDDSNIKYQTIDFKGKDLFFEDDNYRYYSFNVKEDSVDILLNAEGYPKVYLVGFKGNNSLNDNVSSYFVKLSDTEEKFTIDPLYTNKEIEIFVVKD